MKILSINIHLTYLGWSEGKLNLAFMQLAKAFFVKRGHQVAETSVERGYNPEEEVEKHVAADLVILQTPVNWFSAPWMYRNTCRPVPPHHFQLQIHRYDILSDFGVFDIFIPLALEDYKRHLEKHCLLASRIANIA
jgi:hypothetical protein